jgi:hypothetical protein
MDNQEISSQVKRGLGSRLLSIFKTAPDAVSEKGAAILENDYTANILVEAIENDRKKDSHSENLVKRVG